MVDKSQPTPRIYINNSANTSSEGVTTPTDGYGGYDMNTTYESTSRNPFRASQANAYHQQFDSLYSPQASPNRFNTKTDQFEQQYLHQPEAPPASPPRKSKRNRLSLSLNLHRKSPDVSEELHKSRRFSILSDDDMPITTKSLVQEAATTSDIQALRDGLNFALGDAEGGTGKWLPKTRKPPPPLTPTIDIEDIESRQYTENIPLDELHLSTRRNTLASSNPRRNTVVNHPRRPTLTVDTNLKPGYTPTFTIEDESILPAPTPTIPNMLTRISDRIAGSRSNVDEIEGEEFDHSSGQPTPSPLSASFHFNKTGESISPLAKSSRTSNVHSRNESREDVSGLGLFLNPKSDHGSDQLSANLLNTHSIIEEAMSKNDPVEDLPQDKLIFGKSLKIFGADSKFRIFCWNILANSAINQFFLALLILQVGLLTYRQWNPALLNGYYYHGYNWADYMLMVINFIYTVEIVVKIIAYGFYDDTIVYHELGIPYPKSELKEMFFQFNYIKRALNASGLTRIWSVWLSHPHKHPEESSIHINGDIKGSNNPTMHNQHHDLSQKYSNLNSHHQYSPIHSEIDISLNDIHPTSTRLNHENTFYQKKQYSHVAKSSIRRAYIRSSWHRIDFFSMLMFWTSLVLSINHYDAKNHIMVFRALSCLRILRFCNLTKGTSTILVSLKNAAPQLIDVVIFICCFWLFFGIIGVQSFKSSLTRHCVWTNPNDPNEIFINDAQFCGSALAANGTNLPYISRDGTPSSQIKGFRCPVDSQCVSGSNPYGGTINFDNIFQSLELVFVIMSANTFTDIMYDTMDSDTLAASLFYIFAIFILTVWLTNVLIAVIVTSFKQTSKVVAEERELKGKPSISTKLFASSSRDKLNQLRQRSIGLRTYYKLDWIFVIAIVLSLFAQCFRSYGMSDTGRHSLYRAESAFTGVFLWEIIIRFALHFPQWRLFFASRRNCFDLFLATITSIIIISPIKDKLGWGYYWLTVFQLLRFYRVVMAISITRNLWMQIMTNIKAIWDLGLFFFILTYLISIIVSRYFEGQVSTSAFDTANFPFQTLPNTFLGLYTITSTENWTEIMYFLAEQALLVSQRAMGSMILIFWFMLSNTVIMNIFIAIIAKTLDVSEEGKRKEQLLQFIDNMTVRLRTIDPESSILSKFKSKLFKTLGSKNNIENAVVNLLLTGTAVQEFLDDEPDERDTDQESIKTLPSSGWKRWLQVTYWRVNSITTNPFYQFEKKKKSNLVLEEFDPANFAKSILLERNALILKQNKYLKENPRFNNVFYVMSPYHRVRKFCQRLVKPSHGERIDGVEPYKRVSDAMVILVFLVTIALVFTACYFTPLFRVSMTEIYGRFNWAFYISVGFLAFFTLEFIIKVLADGLLFTPNAYMRSSWNLIDMIVLISLWVEFIAFFQDNGNVEKFVRGLKALRALRLLTISETAKNNFHNTIISGFWKIISAAIISLCLLFPFSIWALNVFNGRLGYCVDGTSDMASCFNEYENEVFDWSIVSPNTYVNPQLHFDRFTSSFATLFEIVSLEGWVDVLENLMSSTGIGTVPQKNYAPYNAAFIMLFNFTSTVFILTLFVSVIMSNYSKTTGRAYQTNDQIAWYQVEKILTQVKPSKRKDINELSPLKKFCYQMTVEKNKYWTRLLNVILCLHVLALLLETFPSDVRMDVFRSSIFMISSSAFFINVIMLLFGQGFKTFIHQKWNAFNLLVSVGAFNTTLLGYFIDTNNAFSNVQELFLVAILAFVIPRSNRLSQLLRFASASIPTLMSLLFTWVVVFLVFAIAMNQIFGLTKIGPNGTGNLNLRSVPKTLIVLFRCSFGEGWNYIMIDYTLESPFCTTGSSLDTSDCGNKQFAYFLFCAWNVLSMYIFLNMFVSLILDSFSYINNRAGYAKLIEREEIRKFKRTWQSFDPEGTGYIDSKYLPKLLHSLEGALSFHFYTGDLLIPELCKRWVTRNNPNDPYDVTINHDAVDEVLDNMDISKIRERRRAYECFMEESLLSMELNNDPGISFTRLLLQLPLYTSFDAGQCLNLFDFLERRLLLQKVEKRLKSKRVYELITGYACRWKYKENTHLGIRDPNIAFGDELKRRSYIESTEAGNAPSIHISDASDVTDWYQYQDPFDDNLSNWNTNKDDLTSQLEHKFNRDDGTTSGAYVPSTPLNIYKRGLQHEGHSATDARKQPVPKIYMEIPRSPRKSSSASTNSEHDVSIDNNEMELLDLSELGNTLSDSSWADAYKQMQEEQTAELRKYNSKNE